MANVRQKETDTLALCRNEMLPVLPASFFYCSFLVSHTFRF